MHRGRTDLLLLRFALKLRNFGSVLLLHFPQRHTCISSWVDSTQVGLSMAILQTACDASRATCTGSTVTAVKSPQIALEGIHLFLQLVATVLTGFRGCSLHGSRTQSLCLPGSNVWCSSKATQGTPCAGRVWCLRLLRQGLGKLKLVVRVVVDALSRGRTEIHRDKM